MWRMVYDRLVIIDSIISYKRQIMFTKLWEKILAVSICIIGSIVIALIKLRGRDKNGRRNYNKTDKKSID